MVAGIAVTAAWRAFALAQGPQGAATLFWWTAAHLPGSADAFAIGAAAALAYAIAGCPDATVQPRAARRGDLLLVARSIIGIAALYLMDSRPEEYWSGTWLFFAWNPLFCAGVALAILGTAARGPLARLVLENRAAVWLGLVSYSLYLWHPVLLPPLARAFGAARVGFESFAPMALAPVVAVAALSYYAIERPFLRLRRGRAGASPTLQ